MKYDDASWHYDGDFPADLPPSAGATHIGMFVAWAILHGFAGAIHTEDFPDTLEQLRQRAITPGEFCIRACDEKFTDEDLSDDGNAFARNYFGAEDGQGNYIADYEATLGQGKPSLYYVADTWANFDLLAPILEKRLDEWQAKA